MGQAAVRPAREAITRRVLAWTLAISVNCGLIFSLLFMPREIGEPTELNVIDLVLVPPPIAPPEPVVDDAPRVQASVELAPASALAGPSPAPLTALAPHSVDAGALGDGAPAAEIIGLPDYETAAVPYSGGPGSTPYFLREVFCLTSSDATREAGHCPDNPDPDGLAMLRYASDANIEAGLRAAIGLGMSAEEIRALFEGDDLPLGDLRGQSSLADTRQRTSSSSDEMRDSLPPRHPDPVFGD